MMVQNSVAGHLLPSLEQLGPKSPHPGHTLSIFGVKTAQEALAWTATTFFAPVLSSADHAPLVLLVLRNNRPADGTPS